MTLNTQLTDADGQIVELYAHQKLSEYGKLNDIIGSQIFSILSRHSTVLYYPLDDEDIWGFVENTASKNFVCINTSIDYDKQIFVAAHELYHILCRETDEELTLAKNLEDVLLSHDQISTDELKANRFAAAFLIDAGLLRQEMLSLGIAYQDISVHDILKLANLFTVPYKTMVRRLFEINAINNDSLSEFMCIPHNELDIQKKRLGLLLPNQSKSISLGSLNETAMTLYESNRITVEKLEQILAYSNLTLTDMGISIPKFSPLTDDEIDYRYHRND